MDRRYASGKKPVTSRQKRFNLLSHDQGPSSYDVNSYYEPCERARYLNHEFGGPSKFENSEICRAELPRKLRSCEVAEKPGQRMGADMMISTYVQEGLSSSHGVDRQPLAPDDRGYSYLRQTPGFLPYSHTYRSSLRDLHFHGGYGYHHEFPSYLDTYRQEMPRGPYDKPQRQYLQQHYHECSNGYCGHVNHNHLVSNQDFHERTCSCVHCFDKIRDSPVNFSRLDNQRSEHVPSNPNYLREPLRIRNGPEGFNSHLDFGNDGILHNCSRKMEEAHKNRHVLHPLAGGAPFIACSSCFESLKLLRKHISMAKRQHKLKCGACSSTVLFELNKKALPVPVSVSPNRVATDTDACSSEAVDENVGHQPGGSSLVDPDACCDSNADSLPKVSPADNKSNSGELEKLLDPPPASSLSGTLQMPNALTSKNHSPSESSAHPIFSTEECPDQSANVVVEQNVPWQNPVRDSAVSTEIDGSSKEFPKSFISMDSVDQIKEQHLRDEKGAESSSPGHAKNSSAQFIKSAENVEVGSSRVFINRHLIPERLVQKAQVLAGPIQPGDYWYDNRAGFWGVMGYPCLGIIMPNIEEFNYPMPVDCAAGNIEVLVNGRELHEKDLALLAGRGLPDIRQRSYLIDISGEVIDAETGEELDHIGRLAPTVLREKHGFGMKVPGSIARLQV